MTDNVDREFLAKFSGRARMALFASKLTNEEALREKIEEDPRHLLRFYNFGRVSLGEVLRVLDIEVYDADWLRREIAAARAELNRLQLCLWLTNTKSMGARGDEGDTRTGEVSDHEAEGGAR